MNNNSKELIKELGSTTFQVVRLAVIVVGLMIILFK